MAEVSGKPLLVLAMGDPAGISSELTAKVIMDTEVRAAADLIVIGDRRQLAEGERIAGLETDIEIWRPGTNAPGGRPLFVDLAHLAPGEVPRGESHQKGGRYALRNFRTALRLGTAGVVDAVTFTPFNKLAMRMELPSYDDEIEVISEETGSTSRGREFNILGDLWNARITSHVPLKDVSKYITRTAVRDGIMLTDKCMRDAGFKTPRIAVAGLNPHAGDGGSFGREEIDEIAPGVAEAKAAGVVCEGPYPSDTVFLRAKRGDFDAVQTMYHDQGQIAMKLMGFEAGVTMLGGYPFPICTPAHGTAYDIAGKGIANLGATRNALLIAASMAKNAKTKRARASAGTLDAIIAKA